MSLVGCGAPRGPVETWVDRAGGLTNFQQARVDAAAARMEVACGTGNRLTGNRFAVRVLDSGSLAAFGWPDGRIFVTRGLLAAVSDDELAAAIGHEIGHLLVDGHVRPPAALRGAKRGAHVDAETNADAVAMDLLVASGASPDAMRRLLGKLSAAAGDRSPQLRAHLQRRIETLAAAERARKNGRRRERGSASSAD